MLHIGMNDGSFKFLMVFTTTNRNMVSIYLECSLIRTPAPTLGCMLWSHQHSGVWLNWLVWFLGMDQCLIGLRSGLWEGHQAAFQSQFVVCLGSLSCWKTQQCRRILRFFIPFTLCSVPVSMLPPPCLTGGTVFFILKALDLCLIWTLKFVQQQT